MVVVDVITNTCMIHYINTLLHWLFTIIIHPQVPKRFVNVDGRDAVSVTANVVVEWSYGKGFAARHTFPVRRQEWR